MSEQKSFFTTLPGILTGLAAVVTALTGLLFALNELELIGGGTEGSQRAVAADDSRQPDRAAATQENDRASSEGAWPGPTVDGWALIGQYQRGRFSDLSIRIPGDSPAIGSRYPAAEDFRMIAERPERGESVITLGMVRRGDPVEVLDLDVAPGRDRVPVWAKLRAVVHRR